MRNQVWVVLAWMGRGADRCMYFSTHESRGATRKNVRHWRSLGFWVTIHKRIAQYKPTKAIKVITTKRRKSK
jgi:hypothetical protein